MLYNRITSDTKLAEILKNLDKRISGVETVGTGSMSWVDDNGVETIIGELPDGSVGFQPFVGDTTPPPVPSIPIISVAPGVINISWNGVFVDGADKPVDFQYVNVLGYRIVGGIADPAVNLGLLRNSQETVGVGSDVIAVGETWEFAFSSVDYNRNISEIGAHTAPITQTSYNTDVLIAEAISSLSDGVSGAQTSADGKSTIYYASVAPTNVPVGRLKTGDTWFDTANNNRVMTWSGTAWQTMQDSYLAQQTADSKGRTYTQDTTPPVEARLPQNLWIDTSAGPGLYVTKYWNGSAWTALKDKDAASAQTTADAKGETIYSNTEPAAAKRLPQNLWVDTTGGVNIHKRWDGAAWVVVVDSRIPSTAAAVTAVDARVNSVSASLNVVSQDLQDAQVAIDTQGVTLTQSTIPSPEFQHASNLWIDISLGADKAVTKYWNGSAWTSVSEKAAKDAQTAADAKGETIYSSSTPAASKQLPQNLWVDTTGGINIHKRWDGSAWVVVADSRIASTASAVTAVDSRVTAVSATADSKGVTYTQNVVPPVEARLPQNLWIDTSLGVNNAVTKYWNGSAWTAVTEKASTDAQNTANAKGEVIYSSTTPAAAKQLTQNLWIDTTGGINIAKRWDGSGWVVTSDTRIDTNAAAVTAVDSRVTAVSATADSKGITYTQNTVPPVSARLPQNLWIDTSLGLNNTVTKYWNGSAWTAVVEKASTDAQTAASAAQGTADAKGEIIYSTTAPAAAKQLSQNLWIDTNAGVNIPKRWNGSAWVAVTDKTATDAAAAASAAQSTANTAVTNAATAQGKADSAYSIANGKNTSYYQATQPSGGTYVVGDTWFDTSNNYKLSTYTGSIWQTTQDAIAAKTQAISAAATDATTKANSAQSAAIAAAATDATTKANAAQAAAITAASSGATQPGKWLYSYLDGFVAGPAPRPEVFTDPGVVRSFVSDGASLIQNIDETYRGSLRTMVRVATGKTINVTATHDDAGAVFLDGVQVYSNNVYTANAAISITLSAGWHMLELTWAENAGGDGWFNISPTIGSLVDELAAPSLAGSAQWDAAQAVKTAAADAQTKANAAQSAAIAAAATDATTKVATKNATYYQTSMPTGGTYKTGDLWFDTDDGNKIYAYNGTTFVVAQDAAIAAAQGTANTALTSANGKNKVYYQTAMPTGGTYILGDTWFDTDDGNKIYVHNGTTFVASQDTAIATAQSAANAAQTTANTAVTTANSKTKTYFQSTSPATSGNTTGDIWFDTGNGNKTYVWNGTAWTLAQDTAIAAAQTSANGKNTIFYQTAAPSATGRVTGDTWFDTDDGYKIYVWNGSAWTASQDASIAAAQSTANTANTAAGTAQTAANNAQTTANSKTKTFIQGTAPTATTTGDIWIDTANGNVIKTWEGSSWVTRADSAIATAQTAANTAQTTANGKATVFYQTTAPSTSGRVTGDTWFDTANGYRISVWNGSAWTLSQDGSIATAQTAANNAQTTANTANTTANSKTKTFIQGTAPTATTTGDIWIDTANGNVIKTWEGSAWVSRADTAIAAAQTAANNAQTAANNAQTSANGRNRIYYQTAMPTGGTYIAGDTWFDTDDGYKIYVHNGTTFTASQLGSNAIANLAITNAQIADTTIQSAKIAALDAAKITSGTIDANRIGANTIAANKIIVGDFTNLASDGNFLDTAKLNWVGSGTVTVSAGEANRLMITTAASGNNDQANRNMFQVAEGEQFYGEMWAYGVPTNVGGGGPNLHLAVTKLDGTTTWPTFGNLTRAAVSGQWVKLSGSVTMPVGAKTAKVEPAISFSADAVGNVYYIRDIVVRRKNTANLIVDGAIQAGSAIIGTGAIGSAQIADLAVGTAEIADAAISSAKIADLAVTNAKIADASIQSAKIANLDAGKITTGTLDAQRIGADTITSVHIGADAITSNELAAGSITAAKGQIANLAVGTAQIQDTAITTAKIANLAVTDAQIAAATITSAKIAQLDAGKITTGTLDANRIGADTITASHLASDSVTANELAANSITAAKGQISDAAITTAKIADAQITNAKIVDLAVTNAKIADATIQYAKIGSVDAATISVGTLSANRIGVNTISASKMLISDMEELIPNPFFHPNAEPVTSGTVVSATSTPVSTGAPYPYLYQFSLRDNHPFSTPNIAVKAGDQFYLEVWVAAAPTAIRNFNLYMFRSMSPYGGLTAVTSVGNVAPTQTWTKVTWDYTVPADGYNYIKPVLQVNNVGGDTTAQMTWYATGWTMKRKNTGKLIVDGAIQAGSAIIGTGAIGTAQIANLAVDTAQIKDGAVTNLKVGALNADRIQSGLISATVLDAEVIRSKVIAATDINAVDIIAQGSITSASGVFGDISAASISSGTLAAGRIGANTIDATKLNVSMGGNNLVYNSSFEVDSDSNGLADGWQVWTRGAGDAGRVFTNTLVAGHFPGSTYAQKVTSTTVTNTEQSSIQGTQLFSIGAGATAVLSLYGRASVNGTFSISLRCEDDGGVYKGDANFNAAFTTTAQRFSGTVTIPAGTTRAKVTITTPGSLTSGHWFEVDGVKAELGDVLSAWSPATSELLPGTIVANMIKADAIDGKTITGATVQTTATASRGIKLTSTELAGYNNSGVKNFSLASDGTLTLTGAINSGSTITGAAISGSTVTGAGIATNAAANRGVKLDNAGITTYDASGNMTFKVDGTTGLVEAPGLKANSISSTMISATAIDGKTITGATVQTETTASRGIKLTSAELAGYDGAGVKNFSLTTAGVLTLKGAIQSGSTITGATLTGAGIETTSTAARGVKIASTGITTYDASGNMTFKVDASTGLVEAPGLKANSITGGMIASQTITANNIKVADFTNLATIDEVNGVTVSSYGQTQIVGGYNSLVTDSGSFFMFTDQRGPVPFKVGDKLYFEFTAKATAATTSQFAIWTYDLLGGNLSNVTSSFNIGTTDTLVKGELSVTSLIANAKQFVLGLQSVANKGIQLKGVKVYKKYGGELIVDGAIDGKVITGATVQTETTASRGIKLTSTEFAGYDGAGVKNFSLATDGTLTLIGAIKSGSSIEGATITGTGGIATSTGATSGVKMTNTGIIAYDGSGNMTFKVDAATGLIDAPGLKANSISSTMISATAIDGKTITGATVQTTATAARGIKLTSTEFAGYDNAGVKNFSLLSDGTLTIKGAITSGSTITGATVTGATIQTEATASRGIKLTTTELAGYDGAGVKNFSLATDGTLTLIGAIKSGSTIEAATLTGAAGIQTSTVANSGVKINNLGIKAYDSGNNLTFHLDSTTGMLEVPGIKSNSISGDKLVSGSVTSEQIRVGDFSNYVLNGFGELGAGKGFGAGLIYDTSDKPAGVTGVFKSTAGQGTYTPASTLFDVTPNTEYITEIWLKASLPNSRIYVELLDQAGSLGVTSINDVTGASEGGYALADETVPTSWTKYVLKTTTAPTTTRLKVGSIYFNHANGSERNAVVSIAIGMRRRLAGNLLVDGAITTSKMTSGTIDAGVLVAGSIKALQIGSKEITTDKMVITSTDNILPEADFSANLVQWGGVAGAWSVDATGSRSGATAAKVVNDATQQTIYNTKWIPVEAGSAYRLSCWVKSSVTIPTGGIGLKVRTTNSAGATTVTNVASTAASASAANTWSMLTTMYTMPAGAVKAEFGLYTETTLSTGNAWFDNYSVTRAADGKLVVDGSIDGKVITGATIQTSSSSVSAVRMDSTGIYAYGASPSTPTFSISAATGVATMTGANIYGRFYSGAAGGAGFGIIPAGESYNGKQVAILSSRDGNYSGSNPGGMWIDDATVATAQTLNLRGHYGGDVEIKSQNLQMNVAAGRVGNFSNWAIGDATNGNNYLPNLLIAGPSTGYLRLANAPTTSSSANLIIATTPEGVFYRVSSSIRYKADVQDWDTADRALNLRPRSWVDRKPLDTADPFKRYYGYIAEEVEEHFPEFVVYNDFEEPESVTYDRMPSPATIATLKVLNEKIANLEERLANAGL